jgi:hypothetical protein
LDCIQILKSIIDYHFSQYDERDIKEKLRKQLEGEREKVQNKLGDLGLLEAAIELLESPDEEVKESGMELCCRLFAGGNKMVQRKMMDHFLHNSETKFFEDVYNRIIFFTRQLKQKRARTQLLAKRSTMNRGSTLEEAHMEELLGVKKQKQQENYGMALLQFLQNLCEGHFEEMKVCSLIFD